MRSEKFLAGHIIWKIPLKEFISSKRERSFLVANINFTKFTFIFSEVSTFIRKYLVFPRAYAIYEGSELTLRHIKTKQDRLNYCLNLVLVICEFTEADCFKYRDTSIIVIMWYWLCTFCAKAVSASKPLSTFAKKAPS